MEHPNPRLVRAIMRRLAEALETPGRQNAARRIDRVMRATFRSEAIAEATFAAVQWMRDFGTINREETAYLFNRLLELRLWSTADEKDPAIARLVQESTEHPELLEAAIADQDTVHTAEFFRSHGEEQLAKLVEEDIDLYHKIVAAGQLELFFTQKVNKAPIRPQVNDSAMVIEKILARASMEPEERTMAGTLRPVISAMWKATPAAAVRGVRETREIGAIDFEESVRLINIAIEDELHDVSFTDREYQRLQRHKDDILDKLGIDLDTPGDQLPFECRALDFAMKQRMNGFTAVLLRRYGEHAIANLLMEDPAAYERIIHID
jgi:hypothetical protein